MLRGLVPEKGLTRFDLTAELSRVPMLAVEPARALVRSILGRVWIAYFTEDGDIIDLTPAEAERLREQDADVEHACRKWEGMTDGQGRLILLAAPRLHHRAPVSSDS